MSARRITIGCKLGNELYKSGHNRALYQLSCRNRSNYAAFGYRPEPINEYARQIKSAMIDRHLTNESLWADALNLGTWNQEDPDTTAQRVKRIMEQAANA